MCLILGNCFAFKQRPLEEKNVQRGQLEHCLLDTAGWGMDCFLFDIYNKQYNPKSITQSNVQRRQLEHCLLDAAGRLSGNTAVQPKAALASLPLPLPASYRAVPSSRFLIM